MEDNNEKFETAVLNKADAFDDKKNKAPQSAERSYKREFDIAELYNDDAAGYEEEKGNNKTLVIILSVISVLLVGVIIWGVISLGSLKKENEETKKALEASQKENERVKSEEKEKREAIMKEIEEEEAKEKEKEKNMYTSYNVVFYASEITQKGDGYSIFADLYSSSGEKVKSKDILIDNETNIRVGNDYMDIGGLKNIIEAIEGEDVMFEAQINEESGKAFFIKIEDSVLDIAKKKQEKQEEASKSEETDSAQDISEEENAVSSGQEEAASLEE